MSYACDGEVMGALRNDIRRRLVDAFNLDFAPYWRPAWLINVLRLCKLP
jgi:hypothetical protein